MSKIENVESPLQKKRRNKSRIMFKWQITSVFNFLLEFSGKWFFKVSFIYLIEITFINYTLYLTNIFHQFEMLHLINNYIYAMSKRIFLVFARGGNQHILFYKILNSFKFI